MRATDRSPLIASEWLDLAPHLERGHDLAAIGVGCDGTLVALTRKTTEPLRDPSGCFRHARFVEPAAHTLLWWREGFTRIAHVTEQAILDHVQPTRDGALLVGSRARGTPRSNANALRVDESGRELGRFAVGDAVADVRVTPSGTVWASYFDETAFHGIGRSGLVAFREDGVIAREYDAERARTGAILDVYALNAAWDDEVWMYTYPGFPIVRVDAESGRAWSCSVHGASALAVHGDRVLLAGEYGEPASATTVRLTKDGTAVAVARYTLADSNGRTLAPDRMFGVGPTLYVVERTHVLRVDDW